MKKNKNSGMLVPNLCILALVLGAVMLIWGVINEVSASRNDITPTTVDLSVLDVVEVTINPTQDVVVTEPAPYYTVTDEERELLARLVYEEGNIESEECQRNIVSVVMNRVDGGIFGGTTIKEVIYAPKQFSVAYKLDSTIPNETNYAAVDYVLQNGPTLPYYVCFFRSGHYFQSYSQYCNVDHTYFSYRQSHVELLKK